MKTQHLTLILAIACSIFSVGCDAIKAQPSKARTAANPFGKKSIHSGEPIIIDNPAAFIALVPDTGHDPNVPDPIDLPGEKSVAFLVDHQKYTHIRLSGTDNDNKGQPYLLGSTNIKVQFSNDKNAAGSMDVDWTEVMGVGIVGMLSSDHDQNDQAKKLRWKKTKGQVKQGTSNKNRLGLHSKNPTNYLVQTVTFTPANSAAVTAKRAANATSVRITLCVTENGKPKCDL